MTTTRQSRGLRQAVGAAVALLLVVVSQCGEDTGPQAPEPPVCATPTFTPPAGNYSEAQSVSIHTTTPGASLRYTRDGSTPDESSPIYSAPLLIEESATLKARAWYPEWRPSEIATASYVIVPRVATPVFAPPPGSYAAPQTVTLACATDGARITFTADGTDPLESSTEYAEPIAVTESDTLKARAWKPGWQPSAISVAAYQIGGCQLAVVDPNGGEVWCAGLEQEIRWNRQGSCGARIRIELLRDGSACAVIAAETENDGGFSWTPAQCAGASEGYAVRLTDLETAITAESEGPFEIPDPCAVAVVSPNGGETWTEGSTQTIRWTHAGCCSRSVRIELLRDGIACLTIDESAANDGSQDWQVAPCGGVGPGYSIRVIDSTTGVVDQSDAAFTIAPASVCEIAVLSPAAGTVWCEGTEPTITWSASGPCGDEVAIELLREGSVCATIAAATPNDGNHPWPAARCGGLPDGYAVRVSDPASGVSAVSDGSFAIPSACSIEIVSPDGTESWTAGTTQTIVWSRSDCCGETVRIELLRDGAVCGTISAGTENDGSFPWQVAPCAGAEAGYSIRVTDLTTGSSDESDAAFAIPVEVTCAIGVTAPAAGASWCEGTVQTIQWDAPGPCGSQVKIELLLGGSVCSTIADATENDGIYLWTPVRCGGLTNGYAVRVTDLATGESAASDGAFAIPAPCSIAVTSPDGGEDWLEGSTRTIQWIWAGCCGPAVRIELLREGAVCALIAEATENDGSFDWSVGACLGMNAGYAIRVTDRSTGSFDESDGRFVISGTAVCAIEVTEPAPAASWCEGTEQTIRWGAAGPCGPRVRIELRRNLDLCATIADSADNTGSFRWRVAQCAGQISGYGIHVTDLRTSASGQNSGFFSIPDSCAVLLDSPNGGESWCEGSSREIRWTPSGCCAEAVRLELLRDGAVCDVLAGATENDGSFLWPVARCGGFSDGYAVRVVDTATGEEDESDGTFVIPGACSVTVTSPDGGESWCEGTDREIRWSTTGCCGATVRIELLRRGVLCSTLSTGTANDGSFTWRAARCTGFADDYTVRVVDVETGGSDESNAPFVISNACAHTVTSPNGGESWCRGTSHDIRWSPSGCCGPTVQIELLRNGVLCSTLSASTENDGVFTWQVAQCGGLTDRYTVRIVDPATGESDQGDGFFMIPDPCAVAVTAPNGGEIWCQGSSQTIAWDRSGCCGPDVRIELLRNGAVCSTLETSTPNDGSYLWTAAPCGGFDDGYAVRVTDAETNRGDQSNSAFMIPGPCALSLLAPQGGENWCQGADREIRWNTGGCCGTTVRIELLRAGAVCAEISSSTPNDGSYLWPVAPCGNFTDGYAIRVTDTLSGASDQNDVAFRIFGPCAVTVTSPDGGESWCEGTSHAITWSSAACCGPTVRIELLRAGGVCSEIAASTENDGSFDWTAAQCGDLADGYTIRVTDPQSGAADESNAVFGIPGACAVAVTSPDGGESWCEGTSHAITWSASGCCGPTVRIELLRAGGVCSEIAASTENDGSFDWMAAQCGDLPDGYTIRVTDLDTGANDEGAAPFGIPDPCALNVTFPAGGEVWCEGNPVEVSWESAGCCGAEVLIELYRDDAYCRTIAASTPNDGSYSWSAEGCGGGGYRIRIADLESGAADLSDATFTVRDAATVGCDLNPAVLDFGGVAIGQSAQRSLAIRNTGCAVLSGNLAEACADFAIVSGAGAYALPPGDSVTVIVEFAPTACGPYACPIETGNDACPMVTCEGSGVLDACDVSPGQLHFGTVAIGDFRDRSFAIRNDGCAPISGEVSEDCAEFSIVEGGGAYSLDPGATLSVTVRFEPASPGPAACTVTTGGGCQAVECTGAGSDNGP